MHISEGILASPVLAAGFAVTAAGVAIGLKKMDYDHMPKVAILSSTFFVASLIHIPAGPSSVHLILNGLIGIILGWASFPAIFVALVLQAVLFQFGGFTTIGVNTLNMALPAVICFYAFGRAVRGETSLASVSAFACGFLSVAFSALLVALCLYTSEKSLLGPAKLILVANIPVMVIEGIVTAFCITFLKKVKPELLEIEQ